MTSNFDAGRFASGNFVARNISRVEMSPCEIFAERNFNHAGISPT